MPASPEPHAALSLLLHGLGGRALQVQDRPAAGHDCPPPRPILTAAHVLLPGGLDAAQQRAAMAHAAAHLLFSPTAQPSATLKPMGQAVVAALEDARVDLLLAQRLPGVRAWFLAGLRASVAPHGLTFEALLSRLGLALLDQGYADGNHWVDKGRTLFVQAQRAHGLHDPAVFRRIASVLANDLGQMRVRFEPRQYAVPGAYRDDNSYLWDHGATHLAPPDPVPLQSPPPPPGQGEAHADAEPAVAHHLYPEWNDRSGVLRSDWCTVVEQAPAPAHRRTATSPALRLPPLAHRRPGGRQRLRRQWEGEEIDLDAVIDAQVAQRLQQAPEPRLFQRRVQPPQHMSLLLLLDLSQSTGAQSAGGTRTLLALEQDAALLLAGAAGAAGDRIAIHGFCSDTRARVHYERLLDFGAPLDAQALDRVRATSARWSTRMGAAIRHATTLVAREAAPLRALVVLTDGAPADVDVHDEHYLVEDARVAVQSARRAGLQVQCLTVDAGGASYARRIFGAGRFRALAHAGQLPGQLALTYARLAAH